MVLKLSFPVIIIDECLKFIARNYVECKFIYFFLYVRKVNTTSEKSIPRPLCIPVCYGEDTGRGVGLSAAFK